MNGYEIKKLTGYQLSDYADCLAPDSNDSVGAEFLTDIRDGVLLADQVTDEIADQTVSILECRGTWGLWRTFIDLGGWQEDLEDSCAGCEGLDMTQQAKMALFQIAERLVAALLNELGDEEL